MDGLHIRYLLAAPTLTAKAYIDDNLEHCSLQAYMTEGKASIPQLLSNKQTMILGKAHLSTLSLSSQGIFPHNLVTWPKLAIGAIVGGEQ